MKSLLNPEKTTALTTKDGSQVVKQTKLSGSGSVVTENNQVGVIFVIDTTGSMDNKIDGLLKTCSDFVDEAKRLDLDPQFALISFGDISVQGGGDAIELVVTLTSEVEKIKGGLRNIPRNNGFGNTGESALEAIQEALKIKHRQKSVKVLILITDEPALQHHLSANQIIQELTKREYLVYVIATNEPYYKQMATKNGGVWKEIDTNTSLNDLLELFRNMAQKVSQTAKAVYQYGNGSVSQYLALKDSNKK